MRPFDCDAKAAKNVLKLTISSPSACSWTFRAAVTLPIEAISLERSSWVTPPKACWTTAVPCSEGGAMR